ncbi:MAG: lipid-A-disaccharide synthase [Bacteroidota bacterium]
MRYYIIAGEASGDLHASALMNQLSSKDTDADFRVWGGDLMEAAGGVLVKHYRDLAFMGFWEVLKNIRTILANFRLCKTDILDYRPDVLILVDYPGFNLRIAKWAKKMGIKVFYYISPQVWAWNSGRVYGIKTSVDEMFVILPFEADFYAKYNFKVHFVGHPLLDVVDNFNQDQQKTGLTVQPNNKPIIALLPGSRKQEIKRMLPIMLEITDQFPDYQFVVAGAPGISKDFYESLLSEVTIGIVENQTYALLGKAKAALVTSGTATLETALFGVPQVVCYRGNQWSYYLARQLVNVDFIALVNLIMSRKVVTELIQSDLNTTNLIKELKNILEGEERQTMKSAFMDLREKLGNKGASERTASLIQEFLKK